MATYAVLKPYGMLSQFTPEAGHPGLSELGEFPKDVYPIGRLDRDSEGLGQCCLILRFSSGCAFNCHLAK